MPHVVSSRSQAARELFEFRGGFRVLRPIAFEDPTQGLRCGVLELGARTGIVNPPVRDQFMLEQLVLSAIGDGIENHGADGQLLTAAPGHELRGVAFGKAAAQVGGWIRARDVIELVADVVGFHQMFVACHQYHYPRGVRTYHHDSHYFDAAVGGAVPARCAGGGAASCRARQFDLRPYPRTRTRFGREAGCLPERAPGDSARLLAEGPVADRHPFWRCRAAASRGAAWGRAPPAHA